LAQLRLWTKDQLKQREEEDKKNFLEWKIASFLFSMLYFIFSPYISFLLRKK
jgi:hypothetical protein